MSTWERRKKDWLFAFPLVLCKFLIQFNISVLVHQPTQKKKKLCWVYWEEEEEKRTEESDCYCTQMRNLSNVKNVKFSNPATHMNFNNPEYFGQSDIYGYITGHGVFLPFLDFQVLWTLKSFLVLIFRMSSDDRKNNHQQWCEKAMGITIQIVLSLLSAVYLVIAVSYTFLTCEKHLVCFIETLSNYTQIKLLQRFIRGFSLYLQIYLSSMQENKVLYVNWTKILPFFSLKAVIFLSLVSLQQFTQPFHVKSMFSSLIQKHGYHFSFPQSMMKELTWISNPETYAASHSLHQSMMKDVASIWRQYKDISGEIDSQ
jgi:hypothetical protein